MCRQKCRGQSNAEWRPLWSKEGFLPGVWSVPVRLPKFNRFIQHSLFMRKKQTALQTFLTFFGLFLTPKAKNDQFPCPKPGSDLFCLSRRSPCQVKQSQRHRFLQSLGRVYRLSMGQEKCLKGAFIVFQCESERPVILLVTLSTKIQGILPDWVDWARCQEFVGHKQIFYSST